MQEAEYSQFHDSLVAVLGGLEALGDMLGRFTDAHQDEAESANLLAPLMRAKRASETAAALVRQRLRGGDR